MKPQDLSFESSVSSRWKGSSLLQYAGQAIVSCSTTAICVYALSETGPLTQQEKNQVPAGLPTFRLNSPADQAGAFPRIIGGKPVERASPIGQAALALASLGAPWARFSPPSSGCSELFVAGNGGWNFPGTDASHQRLIYSLYPTLVIARFRRRLGNRGTEAIGRLSAFLDSMPRTPCRKMVAASAALATHRRDFCERSAPVTSSFRNSLRIGSLFEEDWPTIHVDEDWLPDRFSMAQMRLLFELPAPSANSSAGRSAGTLAHPILLEIREVTEVAGTTGPRNYPKNMGDRTRCAHTTPVGPRSCWRRSDSPEAPHSGQNSSPDCEAGHNKVKRSSRTARPLLNRIAELRAGMADAKRYQHWLRDVFTFLFGEVLKEPKLESKTFFGTQRRDITFRNAAEVNTLVHWKPATSKLNHFWSSARIRMC